jgi:acetyl-CoA carboxylase biotin carboxyl carrier protein
MSLDEIKALIEAMASSDLAEMEVGKDGWTLRLVRRGETTSIRAARPAGPAVARAVVEGGPDTPAGAPDGLTVRAPLAGTVHLSPSPGEPVFVEPGRAVRAGATLCVIEAMKVFNEIRAECGGTVEALLVASGDEVEAGQPLLRIV